MTQLRVRLTCLLELLMCTVLLMLPSLICWPMTGSVEARRRAALARGGLDRACKGTLGTSDVGSKSQVGMMGLTTGARIIGGDGGIGRVIGGAMFHWSPDLLKVIG